MNFPDLAPQVQLLEILFVAVAGIAFLVLVWMLVAIATAPETPVDDLPEHVRKHLRGE